MCYIRNMQDPICYVQKARHYVALINTCVLGPIGTTKTYTSPEGRMSKRKDHYKIQLTSLYAHEIMYLIFTIIHVPALFSQCL